MAQIKLQALVVQTLGSAIHWINDSPRAVIKGRGLGISPSYYECGLLLLPFENRRKIEPKDIPSCLIPCLLVVFVPGNLNLCDNPAIQLISIGDRDSSSGEHYPPFEQLDQ